LYVRLSIPIALIIIIIIIINNNNVIVDKTALFEPVLEDSADLSIPGN
jgi:hypothetical protein